MALAQQTEQSPGALDVIFTCDICQASISDIYSKGHPGASETDFQDGRSHTSDRRVTCLWLTQCMHLTCGKHLEGGGAPFHRKGEHPKSPCPLCRREKKDERPKALYAVRGLRPGNFDPNIPDVLFQVPPMKLQGQSVEREALQFQYLSLIRYGSSMLHRHNELQQERHEIELRANKIESEKVALATENQELKHKLSSSEKDNVEIGKWKERLPKVTHYLKQWPLVVEEVNQLRRQLTDLGYAVPKTDYSFQDTPGKKSAESNPPELTARRRETSMARVPTDNTRTEYRTARTHISESSSGRKRKLSEYMDHGSATVYDPQRQNHNCEDRVAETRGTIQGFLTSDTTNNFREVPKLSNTLPSDPENLAEIQILEHSRRYEHPGDKAPQRIPETLNIGAQPDKYLMTGALRGSTERFQNATGNAVALGNVGEDETTYHVYDKRAQTLQQPAFQQVHHPATRGVKLAAHGNRRPDAGPFRDVGNGQLRGPDFQMYPKKPERRRLPYHEPAIPSPSSRQISGLPHVGQNSSPFFSRHPKGISSGLSPGVAGLSANARVGTVSKKPNVSMAPPRQDWSQPRSLNGLSFIRDSQNKTKDQPLYQNSITGAPSRSNANRPFIPHDPQRTQGGYFLRPEQPRLLSSYFSSVPKPQQPHRGSEMFQTPRAQMIPQYTPSVSTRAGFTRDDALNFVSNPNHHGSTSVSFYQNQAGGIGFSGPAGAGVTGNRDLFSAAGGRRNLRR